MTLDQARDKYPDLPVISQVEQLQGFAKDEDGCVTLPRAIIAEDLIDREYIVAAQSIVCDGVKVGNYNVFGNSVIFGICWSFGTGNRFGNGSTFHGRCIFGKRNEFALPVTINNICYSAVYRVDNIGSRNGTTYFFMCGNGIYVCCGCYNGSIADFSETVEMEHMYHELYLSQYREAIAVARKKYKELFKTTTKEV